MKKSYWYEEYFPQAGLKSRGWSSAMIRDFLGIADMLVTNPKYRRQSRMKLYAKKRVFQIEKTREFKERMKRKDQRGDTQPVISKKINQPSSPIPQDSFTSRAKARLRQIAEETGNKKLLDLLD
jgi:hypothetical protein